MLLNSGTNPRTYLEPWDVRESMILFSVQLTLLGRAGSDELIFSKNKQKERDHDKLKKYKYRKKKWTKKAMKSPVKKGKDR